MYSITEYFKNTKLIRDPIYDFIEVPKDFLPILDNKFVQRLRWISQLPLEQLVYPSAQHSRFEHSIGVMYLSMQAAISLLKNNASKSKINKAFKKDSDLKTINFNSKTKEKFFIICVGLCGLLHDIGHAPFSHTLEESINYTNKIIEYEHEIVGYKITNKILGDIEKSIFDGFTENDFKQIKII